MTTLLKVLVTSLLLYPIAFVGATSVGEKHRYSQQQAVELLSQKVVKDAVNKFSVKQTPEAQLNQISLWLNDPTLEPIIQDNLLYQASIILRNQQRSHITVNAMELLLNYQPQAFIPLNDGHHQIDIPAFQVAAAARTTLIHWQVETAFSKASLLIVTDPQQFLLTLATSDNDPETMMGFVKAINLASDIVIEKIQNITVQSAQPIPFKAMNALAIRTKDYSVYLKLIKQYVSNQNHQAQLIQTLSQLPATLSDQQQINLLTSALDQDDLANSAIIALSDFVDSNADVKSLLFEQLPSKLNGGSAALAISKSKDLLTFQILTKNLDSPNNRIVKRSLLALHFNNSFQATDILRNFIQQSTDKQLIKEVKQWLK